MGAACIYMCVHLIRQYQLNYTVWLSLRTSLFTAPLFSLQKLLRVPMKIKTVGGLLTSSTRGWSGFPPRTTLLYISLHFLEHFSEAKVLSII